MGQGEVGVTALFHRAGDVDQQQDWARPGDTPELLQAHHLAIMADRGAQAAGEIDAGTPPGAAMAIAAAAGQGGRQRAGEAAQRFAFVERL